VDVESIVHHLDEDLAAAEAQLRALLGRVEEAQARVSELTQLRDGFVRTIERYGDVAPAREPDAAEPAELPETVSAQAEPHPWLAMSLSDAVEAALREIGRPAARGEVHTRLTKVGRTENAEQVRNTLGYLHRRAHRIDRVARGLWEVPRGGGGSVSAHATPNHNGSGLPHVTEEAVPKQGFAV
jgi:hypothetical protein